MKTLKILSILIAFSSTAVSAANLVTNVKVSTLYVQSLNSSGFVSNAHALIVTKAIDDSCNSRTYIEAEDVALMNTLLAYKLANKEFNVMYELNQSSKTIAGHLTSNYKLMSIF
ncbi:hypothetical protein BIZ38_02360 [Pseudoalteromonas sp. BZK2]|uniref:hypothetical protein n=1 Tax=Pseudoalteromonas sp. BZK2 TaxID=1904458 RepID=UPI0016542936|nr:hypothetical protein [Pseudoalteromonas sp. BZK2]MBC7007288.1 hypothetical protein [Pseudoalteromonas sp. BZK2]